MKTHESHDHALAEKQTASYNYTERLYKLTEWRLTEDSSWLAMCSTYCI